MEHHIDTRFNQVNVCLDNIEALLAQILARLPQQFE